MPESRRGARGWRPDVLRKLRLTHGLSLEEVSAGIGAGVGTLYRWEQGINSPYPRSLQNLASYFNVSTWDFVDISPNRSELADLRLHAGLSQADIGVAFESAGMPRQSYGKLERGVLEPTPEQVRMLVKLLQQSEEIVRAAIVRSQYRKETKDFR